MPTWQLITCQNIFVLATTTNPQIRNHAESFVVPPLTPAHHVDIDRETHDANGADQLNIQLLRKTLASHLNEKTFRSLQQLLAAAECIYSLENNNNSCISPPHDANRIRVLSPRVHCIAHNHPDIRNMILLPAWTITAITVHSTAQAWQSAKSTEPIPATQCRTARSMRILSTKTNLFPTYRCNALQRNLSTNPWWTLTSHTNPKPQNPSLIKSSQRTMHAVGINSCDSTTEVDQLKNNSPMVPLQFKPI